MRSTKLVSLISIIILIGALLPQITPPARASSYSALNGSYTSVIEGQTYTYSLTASGSGRYDEFYISTTGASQLTAKITANNGYRGYYYESNDDFDLYYKAGSRVSSCGSYTCSGYDAVSWAGGRLTTEEIVINNPADGVHHFRVQRYSGYGREYYDFVITIVSGGSSDTTPPTVTITAPSNGATVSGTVSVQASASDNVGVDRVEFKVDGSLKATDTSAPYSFNWDTTTASNGAHTVEAVAYDAAGNSATDTISVTVSNQVTNPGTCGETPRVTGSYPWWNDAIDVEKAHAAGCYGGDSVVVVLDTGLSSSYTSLFPAGSINTQYSKSFTKSGGFDNVDWNGDNSQGHGTSVTATILGSYVPSSWGFTNNFQMGVAPNAEVVMFRVVYWVGSGVTYSDMINNWITAINEAVNLHNNNPYFQGRGMIISMSLGYSPSAASSADNAALQAAIDNARANGIVVSTSAGNDGPNPNTTGNPANFDSSTSVAAAGWSGLTGSYGVAGILTDIPEDDFSGLLIADFSSRGKVEITGVGQQLVLPTWDGSYRYISGTSFSAPQISGVFALMFGMYGASSSVDFLESTLMNSAYNGPNGSSSSMSASTWGAGFAQADAALGV